MARRRLDRLVQIEIDGLDDQTPVGAAGHNVNVGVHFLWFGSVWFVGSYLQLLFEKHFIFLQLLQGCRCVLYFTSDWIV